MGLVTMTPNELERLELTRHCKATNDDRIAAKQWFAKSSVWTQPCNARGAEGLVSRKCGARLPPELRELRSSSCVVSTGPRDRACELAL